MQERSSTKWKQNTLFLELFETLGIVNAPHMGTHTQIHRINTAQQVFQSTKNLIYFL